MSRRTSLSTLGRQQRAASRMTPGTRMWSEQPLAAEGVQRAAVTEGQGDPPQVGAVWISAIQHSATDAPYIPEPPAVEGFTPATGIGVITACGISSHDWGLPSGWADIGGGESGMGLNTWLTSQRHTFIRSQGPQVQGGPISIPFDSVANTHNYHGSLIMVLYLKDGFSSRGNWTVQRQGGRNTTGAGAIGQGDFGWDMGGGMPKGSHVGFQMGVGTSKWGDGYYGPPGVWVLGDVVTVHGRCQRDGGGYNGLYQTDTELAWFDPAQAQEEYARVGWTYLGSLGSPSIVHYGIGWRP